jgi:hypothetical protein
MAISKLQLEHCMERYTSSARAGPVASRGSSCSPSPQRSLYAFKYKSGRSGITIKEEAASGDRTGLEVGTERSRARPG